MTRGWLGVRFASAALGAVWAAGPVVADPVAEFYAGKAINLSVGTGESAGLIGAYPRTMAQVLGKYVPGNPTFIVRNMPGAGGILLANFIESIGSQDGARQLLPNDCSERNQRVHREY